MKTSEWKHSGIVVALCLLLGLMLVPSGVLAYVALPQPVSADTDGGLLQFTSAGNVLGFSEDGVIVASARHMLRTDFLDARAVSPEADGEVSGESGAGAASPLGRVTYRNLWDGVTVVYEASEGAVAKSAWYLDSGGQVDLIRLGYNRPLQIAEKGNLLITYEDGTMVEGAPVAWQETEGGRKPVTVSYGLRGEREVGFSLDDYAPGIPVVIDPVMTWNSFLGDSDGGYAYGIAVDGSGNVHVGGRSTATWGSPVRADASGRDAFAAKLDLNGNFVPAWTSYNDAGRAVPDDTFASPETTVYMEGTGIADGSYLIAYYDEETGEWVELASTFDPVTNTITASVSHFTTFAIIDAVPAPPPPTPASFTTSDLSISPTEVDIGQSVAISILVTNTGDIIGSYEASLKIDNAVVDTRTVTLAGGASQTVTFTIAEDTAGTHTVDVNGLAGTLIVKTASAPEEEDEASASAPVPSPPVEGDGGTALSWTADGAPPPPAEVNWPVLGGTMAAVAVMGLVVFLHLGKRETYP